MDEIAGADDAAENLRAVLGAIGKRTGREHDSWFTRLVSSYLRYRYARRSHAPGREDATESERAHAVIRVACIKSAIGGVMSGSITTGATLATASSPNVMVSAAITIPAAGLAIGSEMLVRTLIHLDMTCDIAAIFGQHFDPDDPSDFWDLYGLAFGQHEHEDGDDPGKKLVQSLEKTEGEEIGKEIGNSLLGESVLKNLLPVVGIITSSVQNWKKTRELGDTVRRYMRYRRALGDAMTAAEAMCRTHMDLLVEGLWHLFIADGQLNPEEATLLAGLLKKLDPITRASVESRFVEDEEGWVQRLATVPEEMRDHFLHALEVAAAVDKSVSLPEQKILARAARTMGRVFDRRSVDQMMKQFEEVGVLEAGSAEGKHALHKRL